MAHKLIELVAFLGNPGREYEQTRHNAAWLLGSRLPFIDSLAWRKRFKGRYADIDPRQLASLAPPEPSGSASQEAAAPLPPRAHFIIPETYMNKSGEAVSAAASFYRIPPERILVVHDELEIPLGYLSLKFSGGLGGHNGLRSMQANFGTADFWRLRIGIGRPDHPDIYGYVLSPFSQEERERLEPVFAAGSALLIRSLLGEAEALLPEWKKKRVE